jgi:hypothetical protein
LIEAFMGLVSSDKKTYVPETAWLARGLGHVNLASGLDRTNRHINRYRELLECAIKELTDKKPLLDDWNINQMNWALGMVNYRLGRDGLAHSHASRVQPGLQQEVLVRARRCGLQLDLALSPHHPTLPIEPLEAELRDLFDYVRKVPFGSPEGVAAHLNYWHPTASAYGGIMPQPIPELLPYTDHILRLGRKCTLFGVELSRSLAAEFALRALRTDLENHLSKARLNTKDRQRRSELMVQRKGVWVWRTPVHPVTLVYGLEKTACETHHRVAQNIAREYSLTPASQSDYPGLGLTHKIGALGIQLVGREISPKEFGHKLLEAVSQHERF